MDDTIQIIHKQQIPFLIPKRQLERDDFAPVRETANAIHFLSFLDDEKQYTVTQENGGYKGELKLRFRHAPDLKEKLNELQKEGLVKILDYHTANLIDVYKVYTLTLRASTEQELDDAFDAQVNAWKDGIAKNVSNKIDQFNLVGVSLGGVK